MKNASDLTCIMIIPCQLELVINFYVSRYVDIVEYVKKTNPIGKSCHRSLVNRFTYIF